MDELLAALADIGYALKLIRKLYATKDELRGLRIDMEGISIPEAVSELENDAGYQTEDEVDAKDVAVANAAAEAVAALATSIEELLAAIPKPKKIDRVIPITGWLNTDSGYFRDIDVPELTAETLAIVSVDEAADETALDCALLPCCQSRAGKLRVFAADIPAQPIPITLTITK